MIVLQKQKHKMGLKFRNHQYPVIPVVSLKGYEKIEQWVRYKEEDVWVLLTVRSRNLETSAEHHAIHVSLTNAAHVFA